MMSIVVVSAFFLLMLVAERQRPGRVWPRRDRWLLRALALNAVQVGATVLAAVTWDRYLPGLSLRSLSSIGLWGGALLGYFVITFIYYWWHRARHQIDFLWRGLHQIHHSPQRLELITSFYKHPLEILINGILSSSILFVVVGANPAQAGLAVLLTGVAELVYHWNIKTPYWLGFIIQRPESHCVHHERGRHTSNFSDLPLWDILFGTFRNPRKETFECGFDGNEELQLARMLVGQSPLNEEVENAR